MTYCKKTLLLIAIATIVRILIASSSELSIDEAYYWTFAQKLQANYFDHPPLVAFLIRLTTANLLLHSELFVRLGAIIASAISTWLIFEIGSATCDAKAGWFAALLYTTSLYATFIAGTFILPDSPQMIFWLSCILVFIKISRLSENDSKATWLWCLFGVLAGLCIMSKVHGIFLWFGIALYACIYQQNWLAKKEIYLSAFVTLVIASPIIVWNFQNDFASYRFHSERIGLLGKSIHLRAFLKELFSEIIITNPVNFFLIYANLFLAIRGKLVADKRVIRIVLACSVPLIIVLLVVSLFREVKPHWNGPAYSCLILLPAIRLASVTEKNRIPFILKAALSFALFILFSEVLVENYLPGTLSKEQEGLQMGKDDVTLDSYGWETVGQQFDTLYKGDVKKKVMPFGASIIITNWYVASQIDYYVANKTKQQTIGLGDVLSLHQYFWSNRDKKQLKTGDSAYYIVPSNWFDYKVLDKINTDFTSLNVPLTIHLYRSGILCKTVFVFRLYGYKNRNFASAAH